MNAIPEAKLIDELAPCLEQTDGGFRMLRHKFVTTVYAPELNATYNLQYLQKAEAIRRAKDEGNHSRFVFMHERPFRLDALLELVTDAPTEAEGNCILNELLEDVYIDAEGLHYNSDIWQTLFERLPTLKKQAARAKLPEGEFNIYRGVGDYRHKDGFSWTTDRLTATFFAQRFDTTGAGGHVFIRRVTRSDVTFFTDARGEAECLYWPPE